jgi:hypothetical protein
MKNVKENANNIVIFYVQFYKCIFNQFFIITNKTNGNPNNFRMMGQQECFNPIMNGDFYSS